LIKLFLKYFNKNCINYNKCSLHFFFQTNNLLIKEIFHLRNILDNDLFNVAFTIGEAADDINAAPLGSSLNLVNIC